jgi:hypothetical protein
VEFCDSQKAVQCRVVECDGLVTTVRVFNLERFPRIRNQGVLPVMSESEGFVIGILRAGWPGLTLVCSLGGALGLAQFSHYKRVYQTGERFKLHGERFWSGSGRGV